MEKELHKQMIWRNIAFWGKVAERYVVITVGIILCYVFLFSWVGGEQTFGGDGIWSILFIYQVMLFLVSAFVVPMSFGTIYIPLVVSFGSKRKEAVWGFQWMNWLVMGEMGILLILFAYFSSIKIEQLLISIVLVLFGGIIGVALGQFSVALGFQFGRKWIWIVGLSCMVLLMAVGMFTVLFVVRQGRDLIAWHWNWLWLWAGLAIVLYIGSLLVLLRVIQKYEVRY